MSRIRADKITNKGANGAPDFPNGITVTGVITATTLNQTLNGDLTVTGNIGVGGTLTYEDVTNIDSVGLITARTGIKIGPSAGVAGTFYADGSYRTSGIVTATEFYGGGGNLTGIDATQIQKGNTSVQTVDTGSDGHVKALTEGAERFRIDSAGKLSTQGTTSLADPGGIHLATKDCALMIGATDAAGAITNSTTKTAHVRLPHYTNAEEPFSFITPVSASSYTHLGIGGGDSAGNSATDILFYTGANNTTTGGTERLRIGPAGQLGIAGANYGTAGQVLTSGGGSAAPSWAGGGKVLQVVGSISQNATVISGTSPATTNLSQTITPSKTGSKMLVLFSGHYSQNHNGGSYGPQTKIYMYKKIGSGADNQVFLAAYDYVANTNAVYHSHHYSASWYDQTGSTAGTDQKYTIYANLLYANHQMRFNPGGGYSQWTILEIG